MPGLHRSRLRSAACALLGLLVPGACLANGPCESSRPAPKEQEEVRFDWLTRPVTVVSGESGRLSIQLVLPDGFHVFAEDVHLTVLDGADLNVGGAVLPTPRPGPDGAPHRFQHVVPIEVPFTAAGVAPGLRLVHLHAEVRGCSARRCHTGAKEHLEVYVHVVARDATLSNR